MCWRSKGLNFKFADKDIIVYKIGYIKTMIMEDGAKQVFLPFWHPTQYYCKNEIRQEDCCLGISYNEHSDCYEVNARWFHSYGFEDTYYVRSPIDKTITIYSKCNNEKISNYNSATEIGKFIIPKDTKYAINENGEIISKKLIFVNKIKN